MLWEHSIRKPCLGVHKETSKYRWIWLITRFCLLFSITVCEVDLGYKEVKCQQLVACCFYTSVMYIKCVMNRNYQYHIYTDYMYVFIWVCFSPKVPSAFQGFEQIMNLWSPKNSRPSSLVAVECHGFHGWSTYPHLIKPLFLGGGVRGPGGGGRLTSHDISSST